MTKASGGQVLGVLEKLTLICRAHGFWQPLECLVNNSALTCYNYGPLGALMRKNLVKEWFDAVVTTKGNVFPVDCSLLELGNKSPSLETFSRIQSKWKETEFPGNNNVTYVREALSKAQHRLPFGIAQHGRCIQNMNHEEEEKLQFNAAEKEELVLQFFVPPHSVPQWMNTWQRRRHLWWRKFAGSPSNFTTKDTEIVKHDKNGNRQQVQIEFKFPWGNDAIETITNCTDLPLLQLQEKMGISHQAKQGTSLVMPHMIQCCTSLERGMLAYLLDSFSEMQIPADTRQDQDQQMRRILRLHPRLAPYKVAMVTKGTLPVSLLYEIQEHLAYQLRTAGLPVLNLKESIMSSSQLYRYDEMGVPFTVIISDLSIEKGIIYLWNRDTTLQEQVHVTKLKDKVLQYVEAY